MKTKRRLKETENTNTMLEDGYLLALNDFQKLLKDEGCFIIEGEVKQEFIEGMKYLAEKLNKAIEG